MKTTVSISLLIVLSFLIYISENKSYVLNQTKNPQGEYSKGLLKSELNSYSKTANYNMNVDFNRDTKTIDVQEIIVWINNTSFPTSEIQFHFYANAYKSRRTLFASGWNIQKINETEIDVKEFKVDDVPAVLVYFMPEVYDPYDSTVAKTILSEPVNPGDSVKIYFHYTMKIPQSLKRLGYARGRNFYFVSQWFPKVGVFENGKWICSQFHPYTNFFSDFGDYSVNITVPEDYIVGATGTVASKTELDGKVTYNYVQAGVHDFVWFTTDDILYRDEIYKRKDGSEILIKAFVQPEREKYFDRYFATVKNCLQYFEEHIGIYPYKEVTLVDVPRTCAAGGMEYPTLFTVSAELFSPIETHEPEYVTAHEFSHQFFYGLIATNEVYEAWLDEGFTSYISTKIIYHYYDDQLANFKFASYVPVFGLNFLSYNEIPIIYTLADIKIPESADRLAGYYYNIKIGTLADKSYLLPTRLSYVINSYHKPQLVLESLERYLGYDKMMEILHNYYNEFKFQHPKAQDFINVVQADAGEDMSWFFNEFYKNAHEYDYKIKAVNKVGDNTYQVFAEKDGDGFFKNDVALITDKDTLYRQWDKNENWHVFTFFTKNKVIAAEIDPKRKGMLDINFANNSYTLEPQHAASISLAVRWFFWIQNALMIFGSIG